MYSTSISNLKWLHITSSLRWDTKWALNLICIPWNLRFVHIGSILKSDSKFLTAKCCQLVKLIVLAYILQWGPMSILYVPLKPTVWNKVFWSNCEMLWNKIVQWFKMIDQTRHSNIEPKGVDETHLRVIWNSVSNPNSILLEA